MEHAEKFIVENLKEAIDVASHHVGMKDYKTVLQEKLQIHGDVDIKYVILEEKGPDHDKTFVYIDPPYRPLTQTAAFTSYSENDFSDIQLGHTEYRQNFDKILNRINLFD